MVGMMVDLKAVVTDGWLAGQTVALSGTLRVVQRVALLDA